MQKLLRSLKKIFSGTDPCCLFIFILSFVLSAWFTHLFLSSNDASRYSLAKAISQRGSFEISGIQEKLIPPAAIVDIVLYQGKTYSDKAPLGGILAAVPALISHLAYEKEHWRIFWSSLFIAALPAAVCGALFYLLCLSYNCSRQKSLLLSVGLVLGTNLFYWSTLMFSHALTCCLLLTCFYIPKIHKGHYLILSAVFCHSDKTAYKKKAALSRISLIRSSVDIMWFPFAMFSI